MIILDLLANNDWERPIYFTTTIGRDGYFNLTDYFQVDGFCYRLVPIKNTTASGQLTGSVNTALLGPNLMEKFQWGNVDTDRTLYLDHTNTRLLGNIRMYYAQLAGAYVLENKNTEAVAALDLCMQKLPGTVIPYNYMGNRFMEIYYQVGEIDKGNAIASELFEAHEAKLEHYVRFEKKLMKTFTQEMKYEFTLFDNVYQTASKFIDEETKTDWTMRYTTLKSSYVEVMGNLNPQ